MKFENQILIRSLASGLVGSAVSIGFIWTRDYAIQTQGILTVLILFSWIGLSLALKTKLVYPLRTLSNLLEALREGDYSMRIRGSRRDDALGELILEANALTHSLQERRFGAVEATALLRKTLAQINVAMFGFDQENRLTLVNDSGQQILGKNSENILDYHAKNLGLADCLEGKTPRIVDLSLPGAAGRWELRRATYREKGLSHKLVFLSDMTRTLHEEERQAWKRLIQILRHEINNSLTPIQSVAESLQTQLKRQPNTKDWQRDIHEGLEIIAERSEVLGDFIASYSSLTRLPDPTFAEMKVEAWIRHVAGLETRLPVEIKAGPEMTIEADRSQLDQLLINIVSNAVEASLETKRQTNEHVVITWKITGSFIEVWIDDDGPGLDITVDPFVPFFTTKPHGSGVGLALSRQIAESHGGYLVLINHPERPGCRAMLKLPIKHRLTHVN